MRLTSFGDRSLPEWPSHLFRRLPLGIRQWIIEKRKDIMFAEPGTINNQLRREEAILHLFKRLPPSAIVETGTYMGAGTKFFLNQTAGCPIFTCETQEFYYKFCAERFKNEPRVHVFKGSSIDLLAQLKDDQISPASDPFFYLDAHWEKYLPLRDECLIIRKRWPKALIVIDDFAVPQDKGYRYDDYGPIGVLNQDYLKGVDPDMRIFYPAAPFATETGSKRGACFLCLPDSKAYAVLSESPQFFINSGKLG